MTDNPLVLRKGAAEAKNDPGTFIRMDMSQRELLRR